MTSRKIRNQLDLREKIWPLKRVYVCRGQKAQEDKHT